MFEGSFIPLKKRQGRQNLTKNTEVKLSAREKIIIKPGRLEKCCLQE